MKRTPSSNFFTATELVLIVVWALVVASPLLNFDPETIPAGREFGFSVQTHHLWTDVSICGWCALWNGSTAGGYPAFVNPHGSMLHPLVIVPTLLLGVNNGAKVALVLALIMAGWGLWWLGYELKLSPIARTWIGCVAVAGGNLATRLENGNFAIVMATAACTAALPALLYLARTCSRRATAAFGLAMASVLLAGQGYFQFTFMALLAPAALILLAPDGRRAWRPFAAGLGLALLLAAPFLAPMLHFFPNFVKPTDPEFASAQPMGYLALNLLIPDWGYYISTALHKTPYPYLYTLFVGWCPVLLAGLGAGVALLLGRSRRTAVVFLLWIWLALWIASAQPLIWLLAILPKEPRWQDMLTQFRFIPMVSGLAVPPLLALAGIGLDHLLTANWQLRWQMVTGGTEHGGLKLDLRWLLALPLLLALLQDRTFAREGLRMTHVDPIVYRGIEALRTPTLEWVNPPFGDMMWQEPMARLGFKMALVYWPWGVRDHAVPGARLWAQRQEPPEAGMTLQSQVGDIGIYGYNDETSYEYATIQRSAGPGVCAAQGRGGNIDVTCDDPAGGDLIVHEFNLPGWIASVDGEPAHMAGGPWLSLALTPGPHTVSLRYRPWDVPLGLALCGIGLVLAVALWLDKDVARYLARLRRRLSTLRRQDATPDPA